jgi:hypothetical protein
VITPVIATVEAAVRVFAAIAVVGNAIEVEAGQIALVTIPAVVPVTEQEHHWQLC